MRAARRWDRSWAGIGAWLTLLMVGLAAPAATRADCSHPTDRPAIGLDEAPRRDGPSPSGAIRPTGTTPARKPCTGPQCSGKSAPVPATGATAVPPPVEWACRLAEPARPEAAGAWRSTANAAVRPIRTPSSVFHPPRRPR